MYEKAWVQIIQRDCGSQGLTVVILQAFVVEMNTHVDPEICGLLSVFGWSDGGEGGSCGDIPELPLKD